MTSIEVPDGLHSCNKCGETKERRLFSKDSRRKSGLSRRCMDCKRAEYHAYAKTDVARLKNALRQRSRTAAGFTRKRGHRNKNQRDTLKVWASRQFANAIRNKTIVRPDNCSECKVKGKIHGHHYDYTKPLEVIWLCHKCHMKEHRKYPDTLRQEKPE